MQNEDEAYKVPRPACVMEKHLHFLDGLRESGVTNMYGAVPYMETAFPEFDRQNRSTSSAVLAYWMHSFSERHPDPESEVRQ